MTEVQQIRCFDISLTFQNLVLQSLMKFRKKHDRYASHTCISFEFLRAGHTIVRFIEPGANLATSRKTSAIESRNASWTMADSQVRTISSSISTRYTHCLIPLCFCAKRSKQGAVRKDVDKNTEIRSVSPHISPSIKNQDRQNLDCLLDNPCA